jgi:hypothetical protein
MSTKSQALKANSRNPMPRFLLALTLGLTLAACDFEQVIELDVPPYEPRLTVGSFPTPETAFSVYLSRSQSALEPSTLDPLDLAVEGARVALFDGDGVFIDSLGPCLTCDAAPGSYVSARGLRPEPGCTYTLRAEAPGLPPAEATTTLPAPPAFTVRFDGLGDPTPRGDRPVRLTFTLDDPPGEHVYGLSVSSRWSHGEESFSCRYPFLSAEPALREGLGDIDEAINVDFFDVGFDPGNGLRAFFGAYFRDDLFAGTAHAFTLDVLTESCGPPGVELSVAVTSLAEDYVRYQQTIALQSQTEGNPFSEPVRIHSNVEGGLGVFAGYTRSAVAVEIE